jgi:hypothetical protein
MPTTDPGPALLSVLISCDGGLRREVGQVRHEATELPERDDCLLLAAAVPGT